MKSIGSLSAENHNTYDVFLSFRGEDTRKTFTDHLYKALVDEGLITFRDDEEIERGEMIKTELHKGIKQSRSWIIIFSKDYASSRWCLDELVMILECKNNSKNRKLLPVFYHVDPSDIRRQSGCISDALCKHEERINNEVDDTRRKDLMIKIKRWRSALTQLADLSGMTLQNTADGYESRFIQKIVNIIKDRVDCTIKSITPHPVGINASVNFINSWLRNGSTEVEVLALHGIGGVGKTTIAKYVYNMNTEYFDGASFLENIRAYSEQSDGLVSLQRQLLSDICKGKTPTVHNLNDGIHKIQNALCHRKLMVVLDDTDQVEQLDAIFGMREWFDQGSKIIITTRNVHLLKAREHCRTYEVKTMNYPDSLELFNWHAFKDSQALECYIALSERIVKHCEGLPLTLQVLGASLRGKKVDVWRSAIEKLEIIPHCKVQKILQISYESLQDDHDRDLFLDIACFFNGEAKSHVVRILDECSYHTILGIENITDRCLLAIDEYGMLRMHCSVQNMGREIIRQQSPRDPGKRSRLWHYKDSLDVLTNESGTGAIEGLTLDMSMTNKYQTLFRTKAFDMMNKLRLLKLNNIQLTGGYKNFPKKLKWLCWHGYPFRSLPNDFPLSSLVAIDMQSSRLRKLQNKNMLLGSLKFLNLSHCHDIVRTPKFSNLPALEELVLKGCVGLVEIDESIGNAERLTLLNLMDCKLLKEFPKKNCRLKSLETLIISGCSNLGMLPVEMINMESLNRFYADGLNFGNSSSKIQKNESWQEFIWGWLSKPKISPQLSLTCLPCKSITSLSLVNCNLHDDAFPKKLIFVPYLDYLDLSMNPICFLPDCFRGLKRIEYLYLYDCNMLQVLESIPNIKNLRVLDCPLLEKITFQPGTELKSYYHPFHCRKLVEMETIYKIVPLGEIDSELIDDCGICDVESMKKIQIRLFCYYTMTETICPIQGIYEDQPYGSPLSIFYPGSSVPVWYTSKREVSSISLIVSQSELRYLNTCIVYKLKSLNHFIIEERIQLIISNRTKDRTYVYYPGCIGLSEGDECMTLLSHWKLSTQEVGPGDNVNFSVNYDKDTNFEVREVGIYLVYQEEDEDGVPSAKRQKIQQTFDETSQNVIPATAHPRAFHGTTGIFSHGIWTCQSGAIEVHFR